MACGGSRNWDGGPEEGGGTNIVISNIARDLTLRKMSRFGTKCTLILRANGLGQMWDVALNLCQVLAPNVRSFREEIGLFTYGLTGERSVPAASNPY